ncbi:MAG: hypothetical protein QOG72_2234 [Sphingomonadales bacterium]|jgi:hypothetical protein|nr:hypothetical protein [Sphingomonadales bacterium]
MSRDHAHFNRRMLLAGLGAGAVGAAAAAAPILSLRLVDTRVGRPASWWDRTYLSLQSAGLAEWTAIVGETFTLETPRGSHMLRIASVTAFPRSGPRPTSLARSQAFSVLFEALAGPALPGTDRLYQLTHPSYPPLPIYMGAPVSAGQKSRLIAVFN